MISPTPPGLYEAALKEIRQRRDVVAGLILNGAAQDFTKYRELITRLAVLGEAEGVLVGLYKAMVEDKPIEQLRAEAQAAGGNGQGAKDDQSAY